MSTPTCQILLRITALLAALACTSAAHATPSHSSAEGFTLPIPEGWKVASEGSEGALTKLVLERASPAARLTVAVTPPNPDLTPKTAEAQLAAAFEGQDTGTVELGERRWFRTHRVAKSGPPGAREALYVAFENHRFYSFTCLDFEASDAVFSGVEELLQRVVFRAPGPLARAPAPAPRESSPGDSESTLERPQGAAEPRLGARPEVDRPQAERGAAEAPPKLRPAAPLSPHAAADPDASSEPPAATGASEAESLDGQQSPTAPLVLKNALEARYGTQIVASDGEYDPDLFAARHLHDADDTTTWRSSAGHAPPHRFVFALQKSVEVTAIEVLNRAAEQIVGIAARRVSIEGSERGPEGPWTPLRAAFEARAEGATAVTVSGAPKARWIRLEIGSNHGHPTLTELAEVKLWTTAALDTLSPEPDADAATSATPKPAEPLSLERPRLSSQRNGPDQGTRFSAGRRVFVNFRPRGLRLNSVGLYNMSVDLKLRGAGDALVFDRPAILEHSARPPRAPLVTWVSIHMDIPTGFAPGAYRLELICRDQLAKLESSHTFELEVLPAAEDSAEPRATEGDDPAPTEGDEPAPTEGDEPAPTEEDEQQGE